MSVLPPSWDKLHFVKYGDKPDFTLLDERRLQEAVLHLRRALGGNFPEIAYRQRHPLLGYLVNDTSWTRFWFIEFSDALVRATRFGNVEALVERIKDPGHFHEALSVLECADTFAAHGLEVQVEPANFEPGFTRRPDLLIRVPTLDSEVCIEVTTLGESREWQDVTAKFSRVTNWVYAEQRNSDARGKLLRGPSEAQMRELESRIAETRNLAIETNSLRVLETKEIVVGFAPRGLATLAEWANAAGIQGSFSGPSLEGNVQRRLEVRLREKARQLPPTKVGLIWVELQTIGAFDERIDHDQLESILHDYPHVLGCILTWKEGFLGEQVAEGPRGPRGSLRRKARYQHQSYRLLENEHARVHLAPGVGVRLRRCLGL